MSNERIGYYATKELRDETNRDIRTHHFPLGFSNPTSISEYREEYVKKHVPGDEYKLETYDRNKLRVTNFIMGDNPNDAISLYKEKYVPHEISKGNDDKATQKFLRAHHFKLGNNPNDYMSINHADYQKHDLGIPNKDETDNLRKIISSSSIPFGDDPTNYLSTTKEIHDKKDLIGYNPSKAKETTKAFHKENFKFGYDGPFYETTNNGFYRGGGVPAIGVNQSHLKTNIPFQHEGEPDPYKSIAMRTLTDPGKLPVFDNSKMEKYLRSEHFGFGNYKGKPESESQTNYIEHPIGPLEKIDGQKLRRSNIHMGDNLRDYSLSVLPKHDTEDYRKNLERDPYLRNSHFELGTLPLDYTSETKARFDLKQIPHENKELLEKQISKIRDNHFSIKENPDAPIDHDHYTTEMKSSFVKKEVPSNKAQVQAASKYLKSAHFNLGFKPKEYETTNQGTYKGKPGDVKPLDNIDDLKREHFDNEKLQGEYTTTYRHHHTWLRPVGIGIGTKKILSQ